MKQGSILAFLQPVLATTESTDIELQVEAVQSPDPIPHATHDIVEQDDLATTVDKTPKKQARLHDATITSLKDPRATISKFYPSHLDRIRTITSTLLPVRYSDTFYNECLTPDQQSVIAFVALYESRPIGWIRCRIEPFSSKDGEVHQQIYIQALGLLAPYRGMGLAVHLLQAVYESARRSTLDVRSVYAHVWENNEDALDWYGKQAFSRVNLLPQYYRRLKPSGAWLVQRELP